MAHPTPIGSAAWIGAEPYNHEHTEHIHRFLRTIKEYALRAYASSLRCNQPCKISSEFSVGTCNLVRKIQFDDGEEWIARLRMPPMSGEVEDKILVRSEMESELATMELVRRTTSIPVPRVYGYDLDDENAVGCPFSILEYICGNAADDFSRTFPGTHPNGIPEKFQEKFWRQIAWIMIQLASIRMPKIGSIYRNQSRPDYFTIGPFVDTSSGPYNSTVQFYQEYPLALNEALSRGCQPTTGQEELLRLFSSFALSLHQPSSIDSYNGLEDFGLANFDLGPNNTLVDKEFNILAVIDWDSVVAVPDAGLYYLPAFMGIDIGRPGTLVTDSVMSERLMTRTKLCQRFTQTVEEVARVWWHDVEGGGSMSQRRIFSFSQLGFFSKQALAFRSLIQVKFKQDFVNMGWIEAFEWLKKNSEVEVARFYLDK
ncbi:hypothetical protein O1611_g2185 [Lasiodiplodia mahajangana]|uniref:Uncharacterized protein n=1 Tax=Lasiodiplodia mahajangana TaxID=1108764 RepID=A0ACC2JVP2_9PEZI|nr:hypothetical protein O1611_g2185 [Lasiodiplodia mahajangana]